jgi:hypothetical protein
MSAGLAVLTLLAAPALVGTASTPRTTAGVRWAVGAVMLCLVGVVLHGLGISRDAALWALAMLTLAAAVRCAMTMRSIRTSRVDPLLGLGFGLVATAGTLVVLSQPVNDWDAVAIWYAKTRALLEWQPLSATPFPVYPELGPMGWSLVLAIAGPFAEPVGRLLFLGLYLAWLTSLPLWLPARPPLRIRLALILAVAAYVDFGKITNGYQDAVVMSVAGLSAMLLGRAIFDVGAEPRAAPGDERFHAAVGLFFAGALGAIKVEGTLLGAILVGGWLIAVAIVRGPRFLKPFLPFVGLWIGLTAVWPLLLAVNGVSFSTFQPGAYATLSADEALGRLSRLPLIVYLFARMGPWYVLPIVAAALTSVAAWRRVPAVRPVVAWLWGCAVAHWLGIVTVFLLTNYDVDWHVRTALDRLEIQHAFIWPMVTIVSAAAVLRDADQPLPGAATL